MYFGLSLYFVSSFVNSNFEDKVHTFYLLLRTNTKYFGKIHEV